MREAANTKKFREFTKCFVESAVVRPSHLLVEDFKKERTDWENLLLFKFNVYMLLERDYLHLRGKAPDGNMGYALEYVEK